MSASTVLRLPLQVGHATVFHLARASFSLGMIGVLGLLTLRLGGLWWAAGLGLSPFLAFWAYAELLQAWRSRPSDLLPDAQGFRLVGGPHDGLKLAWLEIMPDSPRLVPVLPGRLGKVAETQEDEVPPLDQATHLGPWALRLTRRDGRRLELSRTRHPAERDSLADLAATLEAQASLAHGQGAGAASAPTQARIGQLEVLVCLQCGSPLAPAMTPAASCARCSAETPMPVAVRGRLLDQLQTVEARVRSEELARRLLDQPGAANALAKLGALGGLMLAAWGVMVAAVLADTVHRFQGESLGAGLIFAGLALVGLTLAGVALAGDRFALGLLTLGFAARLPARAGEPERCHQCGGSLPASDDALLLTCIYCETTNLRGGALRPWRGEAQQQRDSLEKALKAWLKRRRMLAGVALVGTLGAGFGLAVLGAVALNEPMVDTYARDCAAGKQAACVELGVCYQIGYTVAQDPARALALFQQACDAGTLEGCAHLGDVYLFGQGVPADEARGCTYYEKACQARVWAACRDLAGCYRNGWGRPKDATKARDLLTQACQGGDEGACRDLKALTSP